MMTVEVARDRGWWIARLAYAGQTYRTQGHTLRELREMIDDLFSFVCEDEGESGSATATFRLRLVPLRRCYDDEL